MPRAKLTLLQERQAYERLVAAICADQEIACFPCISQQGGTISLKEVVGRVLETLPDSPCWTKKRQIRLIELRFGLNDGKRRTQQAVGQTFGLTPGRIHQVEAKIFRKLRQADRLRLLRPFLILSQEETESLGQRVSELEAEIEWLRERDEALKRQDQIFRQILITWGILPGDFEEKKALWERLRETADQHSHPQYLLTRTYNGLVRNGITSFSQLKNLTALFGEEELVKRMRNLGQKSLQLIHQVLEKDEKALKDAVNITVAALSPILQERIRGVLEQARITCFSQFQALTEEEINEIGSKICREGGRFLRQIFEAVETEEAPS